MSTEGDAIDPSAISAEQFAQMVAAWQAASARYPQVISLDDPIVAGTIGPGTIAPDDPDVHFAYRLEISQKLPFPGKSGRHRAEGTCGRRLNASCAPRAANSAIATTSILERLLWAKNPDTGEAMSDVQVVDNLLTFLLAGLAPDTERLRMMGFPLLASAGGDAQQRQSR